MENCEFELQAWLHHLGFNYGDEIFPFFPQTLSKSSEKDYKLSGYTEVFLAPNCVYEEHVRVLCPGTDLENPSVYDPTPLLSIMRSCKPCNLSFDERLGVMHELAIESKEYSGDDLDKLGCDLTLLAEEMLRCTGLSEYPVKDAEKRISTLRQAASAVTLNIRQRKRELGPAGKLLLSLHDMLPELLQNVRDSSMSFFPQGALAEFLLSAFLLSASVLKQRVEDLANMMAMIMKPVPLLPSSLLRNQERVSSCRRHVPCLPVPPVKPSAISIATNAVIGSVAGPLVEGGRAALNVFARVRAGRG
jgi:hypothetical protein